MSGVARGWKFYGAKHGWQMRAGKGKHAVLYLIPNRAHFTAALALPDGAMDAVRAGGFPPSLARRLEGCAAEETGVLIGLEVGEADAADSAHWACPRSSPRQARTLPSTRANATWHIRAARGRNHARALI